jgi:hypothetical protein
MKTTKRTSRGIISPEAVQNSASHNPLSIEDVCLSQLLAVSTRIPVSLSSCFVRIQIGCYAQEQRLEVME